MKGIGEDHEFKEIEENTVKVFKLKADMNTGKENSIIQQLYKAVGNNNDI